MSGVLALLFYFIGNYSFKDSLINAIPFCIISSAIAIPSAGSLPSGTREFIIYETSLSDIIGVLLFNFFALNDTVNLFSFLHFSIQIIFIFIVSFGATIGLSYLLHKIEHHVKFIPIILLIILIYTISKIFHLPALIFILLFGLFLGNIDKIRNYKWLVKLDTENLHKEVNKFKDIVIEFSYLVRALFFLLFGFLIETPELLNFQSLLWALAISVVLFSIRFAAVKLIKEPLKPLLYIAPRGLITILLFLTITPAQNLPFVNKSLILQVIILTVIIMMIGIMKSPNPKNAEMKIINSSTNSKPGNNNEITA